MQIVITSSFPFGGEPFLISESKYMPKDTVFFALSAKKVENYTDYEAYKITFSKINYKSLLYAFCGLFSPTCIKELLCMIKRKKLSWNNLILMYGMYGYGMSCYKKILAFIKDYDKENLQIYSYWMSTHAFIGAKIKRKYPHAKFVTRCHGYDIYEYRYKEKYLAFRKFIFDNADMICPISQNGKEYLLDTYSMYKNIKEKVEVSYLGTMDMGLNPEKKDTVLRIVSCSNIVSLKRIHLIIEALSTMDIKLEWTHFGDGECAFEIKQLAKEKLFKDNISYCFRGAIANEEIMNIYKEKHFDVFVNVSETEGIPVSIMEAISFGIPVIATDVGGTCEIVRNGINGFLLGKHFNNSELVDKLLYFANGEKKNIDKLRVSARKIWKEKFNADVNYTFFYNEREAR